LACKKRAYGRVMGDLLRRILEENPERFVSGQEIGRRLGASRAAVWKQVQRLRRRGYGIEGARGAGYRLLGRPDEIGEAELLPLLAIPSFWKRFRFLPVTDSTNSRALAMAEEGAPHGTVVCADAQTGGRGRLGRKWESPPGVNLYLSLVLRPPLEPHRAPGLTLAAAIALARALEEAAGVETGLKWPNDLYIGGRKAAGILAEMSADPDALRHVVVGVGINVNGDAGSFPEELRGKATSLFMATGRRHSRTLVLARFLDRFAEACETFVAGGLTPLLPEWERRDLLFGKRIVLRRHEREERGTAAGVDGSGALLFRPSGTRPAERVVSGEIVEFS
jgi:BirA family biotin operon repressor/biotin-[acetyl-CoA-carboxylase] ligase